MASRLVPERIVKTWPKADQDAYRAIAIRDALREADKTLAKSRNNPLRRIHG